MWSVPFPITFCRFRFESDCTSFFYYGYAFFYYFTFGYGNVWLNDLRILYLVIRDLCHKSRAGIIRVYVIREFFTCT